MFCGSASHEKLAVCYPKRDMHSGPKAGWLLKNVGKLWLRTFGWRAAGVVPDAARAVFIGSPHTSNWDLPFTIAICWALDMRPSIAVKDSAFWFPMGYFLRAAGCMPIDRSKAGNQVQQIAASMNQQERVFLIIAPSGTRTKSEFWKSGFYRIAEAAGVPILLGFLDYKNKEGGLGPTLSPADIRKDMDTVRAFYATKTGKHPHKTTVPRLREEQ